MFLTRNDITKNKTAWENAGFSLPKFDIAAMVSSTVARPAWLHFGAGNIFRGFIASLAQNLLDNGLAEKGIIAAETFDCEIIDKIYTPFDSLVINVILNADATTDFSVTASIAQSLKANADMIRLIEIASSETLQMISYTITEKGYAIRDTSGCLLPAVKNDIANGPDNIKHIMSITTALLYKRYLAGGAPVALVSMDNCANNGDVLKASVSQIAWAWRENGFVDDNFLEWLADEAKITFPLSMIDKITPSPAAVIAEKLAGFGIEDMRAVKTEKATFIAPFVNAEAPEYLIIEDTFPNGRPQLEKAGVYFTDRDTVIKTERMKVTACLNPLHSAMAPFGCLLGYKLISEEMKDADILALVKMIGYSEGLPVVPDPGIISPKDFIDEVVNIRLPNPFMPDMPQRIVVDHSQKVSVRFGETIKSYIKNGMDLISLTAIPLAIAGWLRYLLAIDDLGNKMELSADPLKDELCKILTDVIWDKPESHTGQINTILNNPAIFGLDLTKTVLAEKINNMFTAMLAGVGAVRQTLHNELGIEN